MDLSGRFWAAIAVLWIAFSPPVWAESILFIGNSFTFGAHSPVRFYRASTVTDLNSEGIGGVPALFKSFADQSGLDFTVYLETHPGVGFDWHVSNKLDVIGSRAFDQVILQGHSLLDTKDPGNPAAEIAALPAITSILKRLAPNVKIYLTATWPRADQIYEPKGHWFNKSVETMAGDLRAGTDRVAQSDASVTSVLPVGEAWVRAMQAGLADPNPYDGIDFGKMDLWAFDHYHASTYGYYLQALIVFGAITKHDPRALGMAECSAYELGLSMVQAAALQQVAFEQLEKIFPAPKQATEFNQTPAPKPCRAIQ